VSMCVETALLWIHMGAVCIQVQCLGTLFSIISSSCVSMTFKEAGVPDARLGASDPPSCDPLVVTPFAVTPLL
jgi:hypothetical protein